MFSSASAKQRWFEVWPGVSTAPMRQPGPSTMSPSRSVTSGTKFVVAAFLGRAADAGAVIGAARAVRAIAIGRARRSPRFTAAAAGEWSRCVWVMRMCVTVSPRERLEQRLDMLGEVGAGIDHRDLAVADDVGAGALEGEGAGVARDDAADQRRQRLGDAVLEGEVAAEGDFRRHGYCAAARVRGCAARRAPRGLRRSAGRSTRCQDRKASAAASGSAKPHTCHHARMARRGSQIAACSDGQP